MQSTTVGQMSEIPEVQFGALYTDHHHQVLAYFMRRFDRDTAIDCAAEVFTVAWRRFDDLPLGDDSTRWLYGVCSNVARNQRRSSRRRSRLNARLSSLPTQQAEPPDTAVVKTSEEARMLAALERLTQRDREILRLSAWEELSHAEIAEILGCSRHAADQRIRRARDRLRREFEGDRP